MKVGFITSEYPHPKVISSAGIATSIKNLAIALARKGIEVVIFVYNQKEDVVFESDNIEIHLIALKKYKWFGWYRYRMILQEYINHNVALRNIDILEVPDWTGITAFMKFKVPLVIRFHGSDAYFCKLDKRKQKLKNFYLEKKALKSASAYVAPTTYAGKETQKIFNLKKDKIKTIHYGLQLENFQNDTPSIYQKNTILYIGTIIRKKGVLELAQIFNKIIESNPEAKLILIGADAKDIKTGRESTYQLVESMLTDTAKTKVQYLGKIPYNQVKEYIKNAHVCVFPSFAETLGMVTIESMALQKPVVNTSIGWAQELIDDGVNGFLVHPSNIDKYVTRVLAILNDDELAHNIGKEARKKVESTFDIKDLVNKNIDYYNSIIEQNI